MLDHVQQDDRVHAWQVAYRAFVKHPVADIRESAAMAKADHALGDFDARNVEAASRFLQKEAVGAADLK